MASIVFSGDLEFYLTTLNEGGPINLIMIATLIDDGSGFETFSTPVTSVVDFLTPDGNPPVGSGNTQIYVHPGIVIPPIEYRWVIDNSEFTGTKNSDVPSQVDWLTACLPDPVDSKAFFITVLATSTGTLGTIISALQTYDIIINNNWDGDKAELAELLTRQTKV